MLTDDRWAVLEPLIEACRLHAKVPPLHLRRTILAILWRYENGAKWRAIPQNSGLGGWPPILSPACRAWCVRAVARLGTGARFGAWHGLSRRHRDQRASEGCGCVG
ncbi:transposase [Sabulicella rubraurantiaca]|uniref:transposase n=1 Tax=Sabulicella rubraurantiaca TaxID=2811429 RepID=UPI0038B69264